MSKHTPGPWAIDRSIRTAVNAGPKHVALVNFYNSNDPRISVAGDEHEANANLIAAAPELLSELKAVRGQCLSDDDDGVSVSEDVVIPSDMFDRICAAINKAEGRA